MSSCVVCGAETTVTAACPHCAEPVCAEHRPPVAHDCAGVDAERTGGWVVDLDGPQPDRSTPADDSWRDLLRPSRGGLWLAAGTLFVVAAAVLLVGVGVPGLGGEIVASAGASNATAVEQAIVAEVNDARASRDLRELEANATLATVAEAHSLDMRERDFVGHENPDGEGLGARYAAAGLSCPGGENIYYAPNGALAVSPGALADHVVRSWLNSEGHRETLLRERFDRQGIAVVFGDDGAVWVTQTFC
ncbi:CAP domain-containing protein [Salinirubellus salinus]|uniref:CAP domain-containing protein n=1 Tax=Salinirubellus salinus TaxID=1364945 RepID=A0A9E7R004_9EURY|nr:CAP domain-containing protein [Salinirubellus salinus]UWM53159.1 CAP domain-containing protein [Salinirubellus salinus]